MEKSSLAIGVLDSGIGGLTVWVQLKRLLPEESLIYYADTLNCPYGGKSYESIIELARRSVDEIIMRGVKLIVVACNTITAAAIHLLRREYPEMLFVGMEPAVKPAARITKTGVVGILATNATLHGQLYRNNVLQHGKSVRFVEMAGRGLVEMIEAGAETSEPCRALVASYIEPMIEQGADCVVLGCTHYPFLGQTIRDVGQGRLTVIDPAPAVARRARQLLEQNALIRTPDDGLCQNDRFVTSSPDQKEYEKLCLRARQLLESC